MRSWIRISIRVKSWNRVSMKHAEATGEAFSPQKRTSNISEHLNFFPFLCVSSALLDPDPADQNHCGSGSPTQQKNVTVTNIRMCGCLLISCLFFLRGGGPPSRIFPLQFCTVWIVIFLCTLPMHDVSKSPNKVQWIQKEKTLSAGFG
jgi:hypothetical protein